MKTSLPSFLIALGVAIASVALPSQAVPVTPVDRDDGFALEVLPVSGCDPEQVVHVRWQAPGPDVAVRVMVDAGGDEQLFAETGGAGEKATGPWVSAGMRFVLREAEEGRLVAEQVVERHCDRMEEGDAVGVR